MDHINPYAVMRNTATYEAFKAYNREATKAAWPMMVGSIITPAVWVPLQFGLFGRRFSPPRIEDAPLFAAVALAPIMLSVVLLTIGVFKVRRFRREHPIPDEWKQVPRSTWPVAFGRKPRPL